MFASFHVADSPTMAGSQSWEEIGRFPVSDQSFGQVETFDHLLYSLPRVLTVVKHGLHMVQIS